MTQTGFFLSERVTIPEPGPSKKSDLISTMVQKEKVRKSLMDINDKPIEIILDEAVERKRKTVLRTIDKVPKTVTQYRNVKAGAL